MRVLSSQCEFYDVFMMFADFFWVCRLNSRASVQREFIHTARDAETANVVLTSVGFDHCVYTTTNNSSDEAPLG
jgi:hypothetical protein